MSTEVKDYQAVAFKDSDRVIVRFRETYRVQGYASYMAGETAGFDGAMAAMIINSGAGEFVRALPPEEAAAVGAQPPRVAEQTIDQKVAAFPPDQQEAARRKYEAQKPKVGG